MSAALHRFVESLWYGRERPLAVLRPFSAVYGGIARRLARRDRRAARPLPLPVIVVGNLTAGGAGKTPLVLWLIAALRARGLRPGVVSRGYGGRAPCYPLRVTASTPPTQAGDEPVLIVRRAGVPVAVAPDRVAAAQLLIDSGDIDVLIADDGLQHHRLARDAEIVVVDGSRGLGNGALIPAGPLRESATRLGSVDLVVVNGGPAAPSLVAQAGAVPVVRMRMVLEEARPLHGDATRTLASFAATPVHAVAGIGNPGRFFDALRAAGLSVIAHPFPDHHRYVEADLAFDDGAPVLMTEKDAVKCRAFESPQLWVVPAAARLDADGSAHMQELISRAVLRLAPR